MRNGPPGLDPAVASTTTAPRAAKRGVGSRLSGGHLLMIVAGLLAFVLTLVALSDRSATVTVAVATEDLSPGLVITKDVVKPVELSASSPLASSLLRYDDVVDGSEKFTSRRVSEGEAIAESAVAGKRASANQREFSVPIDPAKAVGGEIAAGDLVDVIAVFDGDATDDGTLALGPGSSIASSCRIVAGAEVLRVAGGSSGGLGGTSGGLAIIIAVPRENQEFFLAWAIENAAIHVVRATGAPLADDTECGRFPLGNRNAVDEPGARLDAETGES